jgi:hypothetical protein
MVKKVILIVLGAVGTLISLGVIAIGAGLLALTGGDGFIGSGIHDVHTDTHALVSEPRLISNDRGEVGGLVTLKFEVTSDKPVFLGVGPTAAVDRYLAGADVDEVTDFHASPFALDTVRRGTPDAEPAGPPDAETFWVAKAGGTSATVVWPVSGGSYRFVLMSADGAAGVTVRAGFSARVPFLRTLGKWFVGGGVVGLAVAIFLLIWGIRTKRRREPAFAGTYPGQFMPGFPSQPYGQPATPGHPPGQYPPSPYPPPGQPGQPGPYGPGDQPQYFPPGGDHPQPGYAPGEQPTAAVPDDPPAGYEPPPTQAAPPAAETAPPPARPSEPAAPPPLPADQPPAPAKRDKPAGDGTGDTLSSST